ncbi:ATP-grasp domain-containing protein [Vibrio cholerae]|uniref:ATP-grasp domain-containing protein n=1 Tax=Vibrio cholerae TaxID=666 RepID=UPI0010FE795B|nr:ATP-grasp domain-containing protein [Vibrio cholerae]TLE09779.1 ATP-grasp domain-containing protein [Vibrio cholerae]
MKKTVLIFTRNGYSALLDENKELYKELSDMDIIYALSVRCGAYPPEGSYKEVHVMEMIDNEEYIREWLVKLGDNHRIHAVIAMDEQCIYPASIAREYFNLPGLKPEEAEMVRNKKIMKQWVSKSSVRCPDFISTEDPSTVRDFFSKHSCIVCKPLDGMGSKETSIIKSQEQLESVLSQLEVSSRLKLFIFEEFIPANIYHLDGLYSNGKLVFSSLGSYEEPPIYFSKSIGQITNLIHKGELYEKANLALCDIMQSFGLDCGVFHFEFFYYQENVVFCEIGLRPAGGGIVEAIKYQLGMDLNREMVRLCLGMEPSTPSKKYKYAKVLSLFAHECGVIVSISSAHDFDSSVYPFVKINRSIGEVNNPPRHNTDFVATFVMVDNDILNLDKKSAEIHNLFKCELDKDL